MFHAVTPRSQPVKSSRKRARSSTSSVSRVPRAPRYNGENKITRTTLATIGFSKQGFIFGPAAVESFNIVYDPTAITFWASGTNSFTFPIVNAAELSALYDTLKIDKVEITWSSTHQAMAASSSSSFAPKFIVCNDVNDGQAVSSLADIQQQPNKTFYAADGTEMKWAVVPKFQRIIYQSATFSSYQPATGFVNSNSTIPHYGTRMGISNLGGISPNSSGSVDFAFKVFFSLRNVK